jgi:crotonobetainyl-CoA:carnitine CoA-transferase CaiB-like acyl-CoA transferase
MATNQPGSLDGVKVLDLGGMRTAYAGRLMADMGADVKLIEPPSGDSTRRIPPFIGDVAGLDRSLVFLAFATNKKSVVVDVSTPTGRSQLQDLAARADVILEGFSPGYLDRNDLGYQKLSEKNPGLVLCSVTPFGQSGPYSDYEGTDLHAEAMGGLMAIQGDPSRAPCMSPAFLGYSLPGVNAALGVLHAMLARESTGRGQHVDVSMQEAIANIHYIVSQYGYTGAMQIRPGIGGGGATGIFQCADGFVGFSPIQPGQWRALVEWMDDPALKGPTFETVAGRREQSDLIFELVSAFIMQFQVADFVEESQKRRIPAAPVSTPTNLAENPHLLDRDYFVDLEHVEAGNYRLPGAVAQMSETPWRVSRPAPTLGEHTAEVAGVSGSGAIIQRPPQPKSGSNGPPRLPLEGIRVTDMTRIWVGPYCTRQLADFGADVIKVESTVFDPNSRIGGVIPTHADLNRNKRSITVDLHTSEGQEVVRRMIAESDAVVENYAAGTLSRWGLGYNDVRELNPEIVYLSMPGWGSVGPYKDHVLFGLQAQTASGASYLWGHPEASPRDRCAIYYADFFVGAQAAFALESGLYYRKRTGKGQFIEISQVEAMANAMAVPFLDHVINDRDVEPIGNDRTYAAPHSVYPCAGDDRWVAIACETDEQWAAISVALTPSSPPNTPPPEWTTDDRFHTYEGRAANRNEIDAYLTSWTIDLTPKQVMFTLQRHGVPAAAVQDSEDVFFDPHLRSRGYIESIDHPEPVWGTIHHAMFPSRLMDTPGQIRSPAPVLGGHTEEVLRDLLGYSEAEIRNLTESGALK